MPEPAARQWTNRARSARTQRSPHADRRRSTPVARSRWLAGGFAVLLSVVSLSSVSTLPAAAGSAGGCGPTWVGETDSFYPSLSGDGRLVTFLAQLPPLPGSDELNDSREVLMRDVVRRKTFQVSHSQLPYGSATGHEISADGRRVAYALRPNLFENDTELKVYDTRRHRTTSEGWVGVNTLCR